LNEDSLLVIDQEGDRHTIFNINGDYIRSIPRRLGWGTFVFRGGTVENRIYEYWTIESGQTVSPILVGTRVREGTPTTAITAGGSESRERNTQADTVFLPSPDGPVYDAFSIRTAERGMVIRVPFTGAPQYHLDGRGHLWSGHGGTATLYRTTLEGDTLAEVVFQFDPAPVSEQEIAEWEQQPAIDRFKGLGGTLERNRIPTSKPYFDGIFTDQQNNTWLTIPAAQGTAAFAVFDPQGRYFGHLRVNGIERDENVPPVVRNNRLHFVGRDALDVQRVYVYRINEH
jgi:hypothetical protein